MKVIALDFHHYPKIHAGFTEEECETFPGSGWIPWLHKYAHNQGIAVIDAETAIININRNTLNPKDVHVISEEYGERTFHLKQLGAHLDVLYCMESPMYVPLFYDKVHEVKSEFKRSFLFNGGTDYMYFPSYETIPEGPKWEDRIDKTVCIMSNKWWWYMYHRWESPSFREAIRNELHTARLNQMYHLAMDDELALYGKGWDYVELPQQFSELAKWIKDNQPKEVKNKFDILTRYRRAAVTENVNMEGYATEKYVHASISGCHMLGKLTATGYINVRPINNELGYWKMIDNPYRYSVFAKKLLDSVV